MVGVYKITNNINGKCYIGASKDIEKRFKEHKNSFNKPSLYEKTLYVAFRKYGIENFSFEVLEETSEETMFILEKHWIKYYKSFYEGYNDTLGGEGGYAPGELNNLSLLKDEDIISIRTSYKNKESRIEVYQAYKDKISFSGFCAIWIGSNWKHIMSEVYTDELKDYHMRHASKKGHNSGEANGQAKLSVEEVTNIRMRKKNNEPKQRVYKDYNNKISYSGFDCVWRNISWKGIGN